MASFWVVNGKREVVKLPGAELNEQMGILSIPLKPAGCVIGSHLQVELDEGKRPRTSGNGLTAKQAEMLDPNTILVRPDDGAKFLPVQVKPLEAGAAEPLLPEEILLMQRVIKGDQPDDEALLLAGAIVLGSTLIGIRGGSITTINEIAARWKTMSPDERGLVRERLEDSLMVLGRDIKGVSDVQFLFHLKLLDAVKDDGDRRDDSDLLGRIRQKVGERAGDGPAPEELQTLQQTVSTDSLTELFRGTGALTGESLIVLYDATQQAMKDMRGDKLSSREVPVLAVQLMAACMRAGLKIRRNQE